MKLHEIIAANEVDTTSVLIEKLIPYKQSLLTYYANEFPRNSEPLLMVTSVFNAAQYGKIVCDFELCEAIDAYLVDSDLTEEEWDHEVELISFQSIMLKDL